MFKALSLKFLKKPKIILNKFTFKNFAMELPIYSSHFQPLVSGKIILTIAESRKSQNGIYQGKTHGKGFKISHSERQ